MNPEERLKQYRRLIQSILGAFGKVSFPLIVEVATNRSVERFDPSGLDKPFVEELSRLARCVTNTFYNQPIVKRRINEVSNFLEVAVPKVFRNYPNDFQIIKDIIHLGGAGYPTFEIESYQNGFRTIAWKLIDLYHVTVGLKPEFNADSAEIYKSEALLAQGDWRV